MQIIKPTLLINREKCVQNIEFILGKTNQNNLIFRPHFKTHQSAEVGEWFREFGITKITVSSVEMAEYFVKSNWKDITIAFPFNVLQIENVNNIEPDVKLNLLVDSLETIQRITKKIKRKLGIFIEIDLNYGRSGINPSKINLIKEIVQNISNSEKTKFKGFLMHAGNTYSARNKDEVLKIHNENLKEIKILKSFFVAEFPDLIISYGDTPTASIATNFENIDELRPGNFIYNDLMQEQIGSCTKNEISVALAAPVVGVKKDTNEIILHAGAVHLSKEYILDGSDKKIYGKVFLFAENFKVIDFDSNSYIYSLSQEHALVKCDKKIIDNIKIGSLLAVLPIHSCLTANLMKQSSVVL